MPPCRQIPLEVLELGESCAQKLVNNLDLRMCLDRSQPRSRFLWIRGTEMPTHFRPHFPCWCEKQESPSGFIPLQIVLALVFHMRLSRADWRSSLIVPLMSWLSGWSKGSFTAYRETTSMSLSDLHKKLLHTKMKSWIISQCMLMCTWNANLNYVFFKILTPQNRFRTKVPNWRPEDDEVHEVDVEKILLNETEGKQLFEYTLQLFTRIALENCEGIFRWF